ncbi:non-ribosomal peptide synthetase [Clostridium sp.]|uniref:non-ribosomal peptide synthetase n=1 Tax=Clostridium sp. TaxID=1506 RepID=UPI002623D48A|nr:non-ribosomal peptide synthetase [Clostridium sp.]
MESVKNYIYSKVANHELDQGEAKKLLLELMKAEENTDTDIAVIGMSGKFPNAPDLYKYWENIRMGTNCIRKIPQNRINDCEEFIKKLKYEKLVNEGLIKDDGHLDLDYEIRGYLDEIDKFDFHFFNIPPREANAMDPCQRLFLEESYKALEDAGYSLKSINNSNTGVFVGVDHVAELKYKKLADTEPMVVTGTWPGILASRISYVFNFKGPCMVIDTACSSGLVSVHEACKAINTKECDIAIAGGISGLHYDPVLLKGEESELGSIESSDKKVKTFDQNANGTVWGEGLGVVVLKKLSKAIEDGDPIHAVIKGSAINNDGASNGITAPDVQMQKELLISAWKKAGINPETIGYIESHGTGTKLGDPIEIKAITEAFNTVTNNKQFCGIGSVKTNIGHLVAASGMASLIKVILMLKNEAIGPTINFSKPNEFINFIDSPVYIADKYKKWVKNDEPRRAGVSSFGFSGTNCHAVIEEAASYYCNEKIEEKDFEMFTISAKSKDSFNKLMVEYYYYLKNNKDLFRNACYTSKIGRDHYSYRLALVVKNYDDLLEKLEKVLDSNLENLNYDGIYFGVHKIVGENKNIKEAGEITEGQRRKINIEAKEKLNNLVNNYNKLNIQGVCEAYTKGAEINWNELYKNEKIQKVNLPVYIFEKTRCWYEDKNKNYEKLTTKIDTNYKKIDHPLLDKCCVESMYQDVYETLFRVDRQWVLSEHKIFNNHVLPGTAYIEMAIQACKKYYPGSVQLKEVIFYTPLILEKNEERKIQTILLKKEDYIQVTVASKIGDGFNEEWVQHCECKVYGLKEEDIKNTHYDISEIKEKLDKEANEESVVDLNRTGSPINLGARWQNDKVISIGKTEALIELNLAEELSNDVDKFTLHTALFDNGVNAVSQRVGEGLHLPFYFKNILVYKPLGSKFYSYIKIRKDNNENAQTITFDVDILDTLGNVIAKVEDYSIKKVNKSEEQFKNSYSSKSSYFKMNWINVEKKNHIGQLNKETILLFKNQSDLGEKVAEKLINKDANIIEVEIGKRYKKISESKYEIDNSEYDYNKLLRNIKDANIEKIIHMTTLLPSKDIFDINELKKNKEEGIDSIFYMIKALVENKYTNSLDLLLVSNYANEVIGDEATINPQNASYLSLSMIIPKEHINFACKSIDIDNESYEDDIINELNFDEEINKVAYRNGKRYIQEFSKINVENKDKLNIKEDKVYVITGGSGGLGLEIGKHISKQNKAKIVLISRSQIPKKEEWDKIVLHEDNNKIKRAIKYIREIEELGSEVINIKANVCNEKEMLSIFEDLRENYGEIKGVVHCAGLAGDGFMFRKDKETFDKVIDPKFYGTWILDQVTSEDDLDFFVMFSSIISVFGDSGQSDYAAGNSYMDSFAALRNRKGKRTVAINWPSFKEVGMAVDYKVNNDGSLIKSIESDKALNSLNELINSDLNQAIPGVLNYSRFAQIKDEIKFKISEEIEIAIKKNAIAITKDFKEKNKTDTAIKGKEQVGYTETENIIAKIWCEVFGLNEIDVYDSFYSLGGDSLMAIQLLKEIEKKYKSKLDITDIFAYPTVVQMAEYIDEKSGNTNNPKDIVGKEAVIEKEEVLECELSNAQARIWFIQKMEPKLTAYNLPIKLLNGELDYDILNEAFKTVIKRHESLRTVFKEKDGVPFQHILKDFEYNIELCDLSQEEKPKEQMRKIMKEDDNVIFDLEKQLFIIKLYKISKEEFWLYINIHHIIIDGWSCGLLREEIIEIYKAKKNQGKAILNPVEKHYIDYVKYLKEWLNTNEAKNMERYWKDELKGPLPILNLCTDYKRPVRQTYNGSFVNVKLSKENTIKVKKAAQKLNTTMHMFLLSAYYVLLNRITGDKDIIIGVPNSGRQLDGIEKIVGLFINMVSIRINMKENLLSFTQVLEIIKEKSINSYKNSLYPFDLIVSELNVTRDLSRSPIFSTIFQYYDYIMFENDGISQYDLSLLCKEDSEQLTMRFEYNSDLFARETIEWYGKYMENIIDQLCDNSNINLSSIDILKDEDSSSIIEKFTGKNVELDKLTMCEAFEMCVGENKENVALSFRNENITYDELNRKANKLANLLREEENVVAGEHIGIMMKKGIDMIIAILAVLKAGGSYIPLDPTYPKSRISYIVNNAKIKILITEENNKDSIEEITEKESINTVINVNGNMKNFNDFTKVYGIDDINIHCDNNLQLNISTGSPMYIIYTSGSTGLPKGVVVSHANAMNYIRWSISEFNINTKDKMMLVTSISFDISVFEIFAALTSGCELVIVPEETLRDSYEFLDYIDEKKVNIWHSVPTLMYQALITLGNSKNQYNSVRNIRTIMLGGEAWSIEKAKEIKKEFKNAQISNMYGPTEATIWVTSYVIDEKVDSRNSLPIGKPIWNNKIAILNDNMKLCGIGEVGTIYVSGENVTLGYLDDHEKTKSVFVKIYDEIYYNTGDLGRYLNDGNIEYMGRKDNMVKVLGYRIETGEIENVMLKDRNIKEVAAVVKKSDNASKLICFYTSNNMYKIEELRNRLSDTLPYYMIPSLFIKLDNMPHTPNGKIDKKYLEQMEVTDRQDSEVDFIEASTNVEKDLVNIWKELLENKNIGINDNFFSLGGDSFLVNKMHSMIDKIYPNKVKIVDIFTHTTISKLSHLIAKSNTVKSEDERIKDEISKLFNDIESGDVDILEAVEKMDQMEV